MRFIESTLGGALLVEPERMPDPRGSFARTFDLREFEARGLETRFVQQCISFNTRAGTLRGLHYQAEPQGETKMVRCTRGRIYDVLVDLRPASPTFKRWFAVELDEENARSLYVPKGIAHGFQTLVDAAEVYYHISPEYHADLARGVRWNDPAFAIEWPCAVAVISDRDRSFPDFST
jgi:dTDP-4-dehydrorhamnose 3,5-epimerase